MFFFIVVVLFILLGVIEGNRSRLLSVSGSIAAFFTGVIVYAGLGLKGLFLLGLFFLSSSAWSKIKNTKKQKAEEILVKGSQRDWQQVLANGGLAVFASALYLLTNDWDWLLIFCIAIASSNSDTWASEIGSMSKGMPYNIKTLKRVDRGTSGAVSPLGTLASIAGSFLIALAGFFLFHLNVIELVFITVLGFVGNVADTFLGAYIQAGYQCPQCGMKTERTLHCDQTTKLIKGYSVFNNDVINFVSGFISFVIGLLILKIF
ncbi:DUF92 domain-containing protein [Niallia sp. Krafla_26]|uniref:DUF92 domain-containing protein n=1 Tax=Niallia sp. Krafla_26 TaxID=3064703 RepID=UPI003D179070